MKRITLTHPTGLHARPAGLVAKAAQSFEADIQLIRNEKSFNGKSIMAVLSMGAVCGDILEIVGTGSDAEQAEAALEALFQRINAE